MNLIDLIDHQRWCWENNASYIQHGLFEKPTKKDYCNTFKVFTPLKITYSFCASLDASFW